VVRSRESSKRTLASLEKVYNLDVKFFFPAIDTFSEILEKESESKKHQKKGPKR
jgi:hypothetical protein